MTNDAFKWIFRNTSLDNIEIAGLIREHGKYTHDPNIKGAEIFENNHLDYDTDDDDDEEEYAMVFDMPAEDLQRAFETGKFELEKAPNWKLRKFQYFVPWVSNPLNIFDILLIIYRSSSIRRTDFDTKVGDECTKFRISIAWSGQIW